MFPFNCRRLMALAGLILVSFCAIAQGDYRPGYIETLDGQVVRGLVEKPTNLTSGFVLRFTEPGGEPRDFTPDQVRGYGIDPDQSFISFRVMISGSDSSYVFLEEIAKGKITAYRFLNRYFVKANGPIIELFNPTVNGRELKSYLSVLRGLFADCQLAKKAIDRAANSTEAWGDVIRKTVTEYNHCKPIEKPQISFLVSGGVHLMATTFPNASQPELSFYSSRKFFSDQKLNAGFDVDILLPSFSKIIAFQVGVRYLPVKTETSVHTIGEFNEVLFSSKRLLIPIGLKLGIGRRGESSFYLLTKVVPCILIAQSSYRIREENINGSIFPFKSSFRESPGIGFLGGAGYQRRVSTLTLFGEISFLSSPGKVTFSEAPGDTVKKSLSGINICVGIKL